MNSQEDDLTDNAPYFLPFDPTSSLSEKEKIRAILEAGLDYLWLEDLTSAKVEAIKDKTPQVWEKNVSLIGNQLMIDKILFKTLKDNFDSYRQKNRQKDFLIAVSFPTIVQIENNSQKFRPLFTIDISPIFAGNYQAKGWDLKPLNFHPILPNLMNLYKLDEEEANSLVTRQGLFAFLENTFRRKAATLQDLVQLIDLPLKPLRSSPSPYLLRFGFSAFRHHIKADFRQLLAHVDWSWAVQGHPAYEYLWGKPLDPEPKQIFLGAFPINPPDDDQALALKHAYTHPLTAVKGPGGHGKTDTVLHKIAQQVVKRAVKLASEGLDESNLTLITSTNNRAVNNVEALLVQKMSSNFFYLAGGRQSLVESQVIPKLQKAIDWLSQETFTTAKWEVTKKRLLTYARDFQSYQEKSEIAKRQRPLDEREIEQYSQEIRNLQAAINDLEQQLVQVSGQNLGDDLQFPTPVIERISRQFDRTWHQLPLDSPPPADEWSRLKKWLLSVWRWLTRQNDGAIISQLNQNICEDVALTKNTSFPLELILNRNHLDYWRTQVNQELSRAYEYQEQLSQKNKIRNRLRTLQQQLVTSERRRQEIQQRLANYTNRDFHNYFYCDYHSLQVKLFELSWEFQQQEALRKKEEVIASLRTYVGVLNNEWEAKRQLKRDWRNIYRHVSLLFPVFFSTIHSLRLLFPELTNGCIDQLIVDEAGQISPHLPLPALVRSRRAMFLGDPFQLEPVIELSDNDRDDYRTSAFLGRGLTDSDFDRYSPTVGTAYHRAAGSSGQDSDLGNGILLRYHYRSVPVIANFCNSLCYGNQMIIKTNPQPSRLGANLMAIHVEGNHTLNVNRAEIERVEALIAQLLALGYCLDSPDNQNTIGVISPYRLQAEALTERLRQERWTNFPKDSIGTVHTFQGGQKSVIIVSLRQCHAKDSLWFINRSPNLLNVAVGRAMELVVVVGNLKHLAQGGYTKQLVDYIEKHGEILSS